MKQSTMEITFNGTGAKLDGSRFVQMRIVDSASHCVVLEAEFTGEEVIAMLAGRYLTNVPVTWYAVDRVGWRAEHRRIEVTVPEAPFDDRRDVAKNAVDQMLARLCSENPTADISANYDDAINPHRRLDSAANVYSVGVNLLFPPEESNDD